MTYPNCYLQLVQGTSYLVTPIFGIGPSNGTVTNWSYESMRPAPQSTTQTPMTTVSAGATNPPTSEASSRPAFNLTTDTPDKTYNRDGTDCLNNGGEYQSDCWELLDLDAWLANWFTFTPQCFTGINCNLRLASGQGQELWTTTFLRETGGPGEDCSSIPTTNLCSYSFDPSIGEGESSLTRARYKYVRYAIVCKCVRD